MASFEPIVVGLTQLRANKLRSVLTLLGIMIGVAAVIGIVSLGEGLRIAVAGDFAAQGGASTVQVKPPRPWVVKDGRAVRRTWQEHLTGRDLRAFHQETDAIRVAMPGLDGDVQLQYGKTTISTRLRGTSEAFHDGLDWPAQSGRQLTADDVRLARRVCLLGSKVRQDLFGDRDPVGEEIKLNGQRCTVVGVLEERFRFGQDEGNVVLAPYTTVQMRVFGSTFLEEIVLFARELEAVEELAATVRRVLRRRHEHGEEFQVETSQQELEQVEKVILVMKMVGGGVSGISLLVGGIGIMNIMLVSVTERTREIGVRKALGAKPGHILSQFLAEAVVLSLAGALLGVFLGVGFGLAIAQLIHHFDPASPFSSVVAPASVLLAIGFAMVVGVFFGVYPAYRASRLDPVEALRHE